MFFIIVYDMGTIELEIFSRIDKEAMFFTNFEFFQKLWKTNINQSFYFIIWGNEKKRN